MLDLNHPQTPHVFAASRQLDLILDYCKRMSLSGTAERRFMMEVIRPAFAALRWLNTARFSDSSAIAAAIARLEQQCTKLVELPLVENVEIFSLSKCPSCSTKPVTPSQYNPVPYCMKCTEVFMPALESCRKHFGTDAI